MEDSDHTLTLAGAFVRIFKIQIVVKLARIGTGLADTLDNLA
jgi:hypothetical protein